MTDDEALCAVVLAAGEGARLRPLTRLRPKPLCPVGNVALVDHALSRVTTVIPPTAAPTDVEVAVNLHHGRGQIAEHLDGRPVHLSVEEPEALGTAGALGQLRPWIAGRPALVVNGDTWCPGSLLAAAQSWDRERVRLLVVGEDELGPGSRVAGAFMPWSEISGLSAEPAGLYEASWRRLADTGQLDIWRWDGPCLDCGTPARYLTANLVASGGQSVIGQDSTVQGTLERSVVWDGAEVMPGEHLVDAIRADHRITVLVR